MAISNFGELKTELSDTMFHQRFAAEYVNRTMLFEAAANRRLRVRPMETSADLTTVAGDVAVPTDYLVWRTVLWTGRTPSVELDYVHPAYLESTTAGSDGGDPQHFHHRGQHVQGAARARYRQRLRIPLLPENPHHHRQRHTTNWLLTAYPDAYLFGVLAELFALGRNIEGAQLYKARRDEVFAEIIQLSALTTGATSSQVREAEYF